MTSNNNPLFNGSPKKQFYFELIKFLLMALIIPALAAIWQLDRTITYLRTDVVAVKAAIERHDRDTDKGQRDLGLLHHSVLGCCSKVTGCHH